MKSGEVMAEGLLELGKFGLKLLRWLLDEFSQLLKSKIFDVLFEWLKSNPNQLVEFVEWMHNFVQALSFLSFIPGNLLLLATLLAAAKIVLYMIEHWEEIAAWLTQTTRPVVATIKQQTSNGWVRHEDAMKKCFIVFGSINFRSVNFRNVNGVGVGDLLGQWS